MIFTKKESFTKEEIEKLKEQFDIFIKTVIDIERKICVAGMKMHFEYECILLEQKSQQSDVWVGE